MANTPYIETEILPAIVGRAFRYVFARDVKGVVNISPDKLKATVFLSFPDRADARMWEPKRVLPLLRQFAAESGHGIDCWSLSFPATVLDEALREIDDIIRHRRFYGEAT